MIETGEPSPGRRLPVWPVIESTCPETDCDAAGEDRSSRPRAGVVGCQNKRNTHAESDIEAKFMEDPSQSRLDTLDRRGHELSLGPDRRVFYPFDESICRSFDPQREHHLETRPVGHCRFVDDVSAVGAGVGSSDREAETRSVRSAPRLRASREPVEQMRDELVPNAFASIFDSETQVCVAT